MEDETDAPLAGESESTALSDDEAASLIEQALDSDETEAEAAPAGDDGEDPPAQQASDDESGAETKADAEAAKPEDDDDPEVILRDNTKVKLSELKRIAGDTAGEIQRARAETQAKEAEIQARAAQIAQQQKFFGEVVPAAMAIVQSQIPPKATDEMWADDPIAAAQQDRAHEAGLARLRAFQGAMQAQHQQSAQEKSKAVTTHLQREHEALLKEMPQMADQKVRSEFLGKMMETGKAAGFSDAELNNISDHRIFKILDKAIKYDELMARKPVVEKKAQAAAPVQAPGRRVTPAEQRAQTQSEHFERLRRTHREDDAVKAIASLL
jgi:hypothetical protein